MGMIRRIFRTEKQTSTEQTSQCGDGPSRLMMFLMRVIYVHKKAAGNHMGQHFSVEMRCFLRGFHI